MESLEEVIASSEFSDINYDFYFPDNCEGLNYKLNMLQKQLSDLIEIHANKAREKKAGE